VGYQKYIFFLLLFCAGLNATAQETSLKPDSAKLYKDIETFSKKRITTNFLYGVFFKPVDVKAIKKTKKKKRIIQRPYIEFEGKIIREISIITLDPFGYSVNDTAAIPQFFVYRTGNKMHVKTQRITIRNLLLFAENEPFNTFLVKESERLIRSQMYVQEVSFYVAFGKKNRDSVDIYIRELDKWSIIPEVAIASPIIMTAINDENFLGMGHEFKNTISRNFSTGVNMYSTYYSIPNIRNTYIKTILHFDIDGLGNNKRNLTIDRPFYSPFAKWAAGISLANQSVNDSFMNTNLINIPLHLKFNSQDYWVGKAQQIFKGNTEDQRATNLILTARYYHILYSEKPIELDDPLQMYANEELFLLGIGVSTRKYIQDKYVFNYGIVEDVPVGAAYAVTMGFQNRNKTDRLYLGIRYSFGNYYDWGYLSSNFEYGTFFRKTKAEQGAFTAGIDYFTNLFELGNWRFRQFVKPQLTLGINRFTYEYLTINNGNGLRGFNSESLKGTKKIVFTLQTQSYSPWNAWGFRFGPYFIYSLGILGNKVSGFKHSKVFSQISLGVLIKNDFLVFNIFQFSVAFYPIIPDEGYNIFKLDPNATTDFGFRDFTIGKPEVVSYR
jgi:hypothetical protein